MQTTSRSTRTGFTLVELLVVIGIIALLIAILVPTLSRARDQANRTKCMANAKQIITATIMYANENNGRLPFANWKSGETGGAFPGQAGWLYMYDNSGAGDAQFNNLDIIENGLLYPFLKIKEVFRCPQDFSPYPNNTTRQLSSYIMNGAVVSYGASNPMIGHKITKFKPDAMIYWEPNESVTAYWNDGASWPDEGGPERHGKGGCLAIIDGHVEWYNNRDFAAEVYREFDNQTGGMLFCDPSKMPGTGGVPALGTTLRVPRP